MTQWLLLAQPGISSVFGNVRCWAVNQTFGGVE